MAKNHLVSVLSVFFGHTSTVSQLCLSFCISKASFHPLSNSGNFLYSHCCCMMSHIQFSLFHQWYSLFFSIRCACCQYQHEIWSVCKKYFHFWLTLTVSANAVKCGWQWAEVIGLEMVDWLILGAFQTSSKIGKKRQISSKSYCRAYKKEINK